MIDPTSIPKHVVARANDAYLYDPRKQDADFMALAIAAALEALIVDLETPVMVAPGGLPDERGWVPIYGDTYLASFFALLAREVDL